MLDTAIFNDSAVGASGVLDTGHATFNPTDTIVSVSYALGYTDVETSFWTVTFTAVPFTHDEATNRDIEVDGYGELTTPLGTFDVLRVKVEETEIILDTLIGGFGERDTSVDHYYEYWAKGIGNPIVTVWMDSTYSQVWFIEYVRAFPVGIIGGPYAPDELEIYPNPASDYLELSYDNYEGKVVYMYNVVGHEVIRQELSSNITTLDLSGLEKGIYFATVLTYNNRVVAFDKIVINK